GATTGGRTHEALKLTDGIPKITIVTDEGEILVRFEGAGLEVRGDARVTSLGRTQLGPGRLRGLRCHGGGRSHFLLLLGRGRIRSDRQVDPTATDDRGDQQQRPNRTLAFERVDREPFLDRSDSR